MDLNVIMDVLLYRQSFSEPLARVLAVVESGLVTRNAAHCAGGPLPTLQPAEFTALL